MRAEHPDGELARRAAAGDTAAFATLYDRHERRAYNLCYRITGSADDAADATQETFLRVLERLPRLGDRELNFGSYVLTAARHASYDAIARRKRMTPSEAIPDSALPAVAGADQPALLDAHQEQIRVANAALPPRQREVLALRELEELSYDEVAEIMGMNRNAVAQLISRARLNLRDALRRGALGSIPAASPDCEAALPLLALAQDNGLDDAARADWLATHLTGCATCRVRLEAMAEAGTAYRLWLPLAAVPWLRAETAQAAASTASPAHDAPRAGDTARAPGDVSLRGDISPRRIAALAGAGAAIIALAGLVAADAVHAPARVMRAAVVSTPTPTPTPQRRVSRRHRIVTPTPRHTELAVVPTPVPTAVPTAVAVVPQPKPKPKPRPRHAEVTDVPVEVVLPVPVPTPTPTPTATPTPTPTPDPPPPPKPPRGCPNCPLVSGQPPPVP